MSELFIHYGSDPAVMTERLLEAADIRVPRSARVCIKPNLVVEKPADSGATTHPEIVEGIVRYLKGIDVTDLTIAEGAWVGDSTKRAFEKCGYRDLAGRHGVKLLDTKSDKSRAIKADGEIYHVCESVLSCDYLINVPVLKGHCQTGMTCCLKNMKGCIPDAEKRRFHTAGLHRQIAALNLILKPNLHIVDSICGDLSFEEGGNPVESNRVLLGFDPVLTDSYGARLMGYDPDQILHLRHARALGVGRYWEETDAVTALGEEDRPQVTGRGSRAAQALARYIEEDGACSACYAALIFALDKTGLKPKERIKIGQGFRGKDLPGLGVGRCTAGCGASVEGCPPSGLEVARFLEKQRV